MKKQILFIICLMICILSNQYAFSQTKEFKLSVKQPPIEQCISTGIDQYKLTNLEVFPNPSQGMITIVFTSNTALSNLNIQICTLDGSSVYFLEKQKLEKIISETIDISWLPKGVYLLKFSEDRKSYFTKIVLL